MTDAAARDRQFGECLGGQIQVKSLVPIREDNVLFFNADWAKPDRPNFHTRMLADAVSGSAGEAVGMASGCYHDFQMFGLERGNPPLDGSRCSAAIRFHPAVAEDARTALVPYLAAP